MSEDPEQEREIPHGSASAPRVSIVVPTFNGACWIEQTLDSALRQSYRDFELIVVDDGSTDNTADLIGKYGSRLRYIRQANSGPAVARNTGIRNAKGAYIALLDADDVWEADKLERQVKILDEFDGVGLVFSDYRPMGVVVDYKKGFARAPVLARIPKRQLGPGAVLLDRPSVFEDLLQDFFSWTSTLLLRRSCIDRAGLFNTGLRYAGEDWQFCLQISKFCQFAYIDACLVSRREHISSLSKQGRDDAEVLKVLESLARWGPLTLPERRAVLERLARTSLVLGRKLSASDARGARTLFARCTRASIKLVWAGANPSLLYQGLTCYGISYLPRRYAEALRSLRGRSSL
jgi:glycosyltransferase involved in cell wall biosynthesis